jgi:hypothetical protein
MLVRRGKRVLAAAGRCGALCAFGLNGFICHPQTKVLLQRFDRESPSGARGDAYALPTRRSPRLAQPTAERETTPCQRERRTRHQRSGSSPAGQSRDSQCRSETAGEPARSDYQIVAIGLVRSESTQTVKALAREPSGRCRITPQAATAKS